VEGILKRENAAVKKVLTQEWNFDKYSKAEACVNFVVSDQRLKV